MAELVTKNLSGSPGGGGNNGNSSSNSVVSGGGGGGGSGPGSTSTPSSVSNNSLGIGAQPEKLKSILPSPKQCIYTPFYCEENIYNLCDKIRQDYPQELPFCAVAFVSNPKRMIPLWKQKSGKNEEKLAIWDYHTILFYNPDDRCVIYDLESDLPFPTHFHKYVTETFRTDKNLQSEYHRFFRVISAPKYLALFSSDRSHMRTPDGEWIKTPPTYPPIFRGGSSNLDKFLDMDSTKPKTEFGELFNLMDLVRRYHKPKQLS